MYQERIKVIIRQADSYDKKETLLKGVEVAKFDFTKNIKKSIIFTCKGIISSILDYESH